jgi:alkanesulfonate monooxygenase SsuD/methylene tetrahydromethanopterin reductase-like flavin-dependent oxidoreductase (luciferase family)
MTQNLQALSGGRFCLGLGAGWDQPEFEAMNIPFDSPGHRSDQFEAALRACRAPWPRLARDPGTSQPLLLVGGEGEQRTLPAAAAHADVVNWQVGISEFARKSHVLARLCEAAGRDRGALYGTAATIEATIEEYTGAGCGDFMVFCNSAPASECLDQLLSIRAVQRAVAVAVPQTA